ncbi:MAG: PAS domain S-box protein [Cyanobacteriota bacterium]|nr:PAS domain S-box protein [Cyanobacteriota bacterium]
MSDHQPIHPQLKAAIISDPLLVSGDTTVKVALAQMTIAADRSRSPQPLAIIHTEARSTCVFILREERLVGLFTAQDGLRLSAHGDPLDQILIEQVMTPLPICLRVGDLTEPWATLTLLQEHGLLHLPVVDDQDRPIGLLTQSTLLEALHSPTLHKQAEQQTLLAQLVTQIRASLKLQDILETTVERVRQILGCDRVSIWQFTENWDTVVVAESTHSPLSFIGEEINDNCFQASYLEEYRQEKVRVVPDIYTTPMSDCHRELLIRLQTRAKILVPILCGDHLWGLISACESQHPRHWQPEEVELLQSLAAHLSVALQQAILHQHLQKELDERHQVEANLRKAEYSLKMAQQIAQLGFWELDHCSGDVFWSGEVFNIFEEEEGSFVPSQQLFWQHVHPDDLPMVTAAYAEHLQHRRPYHITHRIVLADGRVKHVQEECQTQFAENGIPIVSCGTIIDITDLKEAQLTLEQFNASLTEQIAHRTSELHHREAQLQDFLDNANDLIQSVRLDTGKFDYVNRAWQETLGYSAAEIENLTVFDVLHPNCHAHCREVLIQLATKKLQTLEHLELTFFSKAGQPILVEGSINCRYEVDPSGQEHPVATRAIFRNITERKQAELALQESEARYRQIVETASEGIWMIDTQANTIFCNPALVNMLGVSAEQIVGSSVFAFVPQENHAFLQERLKCRQQGIPEQYELPLRRPSDGSTFFVLVSARPQYDEVGQFIGSLAMLTDITERKLAEKRMEQDNNFRQQILDNMAEGLCVCHPIPEPPFLRFTVWNPQMQVITGYSQEDMNRLGWDHSLYPDPEVRRQAITRMEEMQRGQHFLAEEWEIQHRDGSTRTITITTSQLVDAHGQANFLAVIQDISDRKHTELILQQSEAHLRTAQRIGQIGSWEFDLLTGQITWSEEVFRMFDYDPTQPTPSLEAFEQMLLPADRLYHQQVIHLAIEEQQPYEIEFSCYKPDGSLGYFLARGEPFTDKARRVVKLIGTILDITEQKTAEFAKQELIQELSAFKLALDRAATVAITDRDGVILYVNDRMCEVTGYSRDELIGGSNFLIESEIQSENFYQDLLITISQGDVWQGEVCNRAKSGYLYWERATIVPLLDAQNYPSKYLAIRFDITERKKAELALQSKTDALDRFFSLSVDLMLIGTADGQIVRINQQWENLLGYSIAELEGTSFSSYVHLEYVDKTFSHNLVPGHSAPSFSNRLTCRDGSYRWLEWRVVLSGDLVFAVARDISERVRQEEESQQRAEREALLREVTQRIRQSLDLQTIFDTACQEIRRVLQADRVGVFKFDPESNGDDGQFVAESVETGLPSALAIRIHDHCFGQEYAPLYRQGRYAAMDDIYKLSECHTNVLALIQVRANLVVPLICGDRLWGLLCIHQCHQVRHWYSIEIDLAQQLANQLAIAIQQANLVEQLQQELWERAQTQQQLTTSNQQLAISNEKLARATRLKDEFLANMSHELRTPLNAILGMSEGLQEGVFGSISAEQQRALETIERSGSHLLELINDILDLSKIEAGRVELDAKPTPVAPLCAASIAFVRQQALQKQIQIETTLPSDLPELLIDERRVRQVLINLLSNAIKFTPQGGRITVEIRHKWQVPLQLQGLHYRTNYRSEKDPKLNKLPLSEKINRFLYISVLDTGIGITPEDMDRLFQPFIQVDSALNRQYSGTGLGLALVKRIVEMHGGEVGLASKPGVGSCFMISLPCVAGSLSPSISLSPQIPSETDLPLLSPSAPLVLLAEDNEANISTMTSYLKAKGYSVIVAKDGQEAIDLTRSQNPNIILMDIQMPGVDGLAAMREIRRDPQYRQIPIIALTSLAMYGDQDRCMEAGATSYMSKPVKLKELIVTMEKLLLAARNGS